MQIKVTDVRVSKVKTYQVAEIAYQDYRGEAKSWKLMSFSNPAVFAILKDAKQGDTFEITLGKNDKDYTVWTQAVKVEGATTGAVGGSPAGSGAAPKAAWVPDADRQRLIVKQSCLAQAIVYLQYQGPNGTEEDAMRIADQFVAWVYDVPAIEGAPVE